jgi:hypothetical protein
MNEQPGQPSVSSGPNMKMEHEQLGAPVEEFEQCFRAFVGVEAVLGVDAHPRKLASLSRELVTAPGQLLLSLQ